VATVPVFNAASRPSRRDLLRAGLATSLSSARWSGDHDEQSLKGRRGFLQRGQNANRHLLWPVHSSPRAALADVPRPAPPLLLRGKARHCFERAPAKAPPAPKEANWRAPTRPSALGTMRHLPRTGGECCPDARLAFAAHAVYKRANVCPHRVRALLLRRNQIHQR
ncbi:unnamed protein product, partial [Ixodes persulcatus]